MQPRIAFVGFGNLGQALARGAVAAGLDAPSEIGVLESDGQRRALALAEGFRESRRETLADAEVVVVAVKPQQFADAARAIGPIGADGPLVVSVMAGVGSGAIRAALGGAARVGRAMPNTPAAARRAVTAVASDVGLAEPDLRAIEELFGAVGRTVRVPEALFDAVTAVGGSGPAFIYRTLEATIAAAQELGLPEEVADVVARETLAGAVALLDAQQEEPQVLRARVTSRGGTTAAGIARMEDPTPRPGGIDALILETLRAARDRGRELGAS